MRMTENLHTNAIEMVEVGPRDGLQNEARNVWTRDKLILIERAIDAGARRIEVTSFVHPRAVPQMADAEEVCAGLPQRSDVTYIGLVLNQRGAERAIATASIDQLGAACLTTDGFAAANQNQTSAGSVETARTIIGVTGALWVARNAGFRSILTLDVGGTSTDVALIEELEPRRSRTTDVGHLSVRASSLDVKTVGAGGGSIAHVPELTGAWRVGPQSAGAMPGPVAYGKGGEQPTVTDANVVLGYLPEDLLGGSFRLHREGARRAVQTIADALGIPLMDAARGIIDIVNKNMFGALRMISVQQGYDPRHFALMGFGGAGPLHVNAVARLMGSWPAIVPVSPGVLCALGDATTRMRTETARSFSRPARDTDGGELRRTCEEQTGLLAPRRPEWHAHPVQEAAE